MGFAQEIKALHTNKQYPRFARQVVLPGIDTGIGAELATHANTCTYGDWADIALPAAIVREKLIVGIILDTPSAGDIFTVDIGLTFIPSPAGGTIYANAAAVKAAVTAGTITDAQAHRAEVRVEVATDAGAIEMIPLTFPVYVNTGWGIIGRVKSLGGGAATIQASVALLEYFE
jgi:hypothetical protein